MDFSWAEQFPEVHKICTLFQMTEISNPVKYNYKPLCEYLQDGPQCGLVALAMCMGSPNTKTLKLLYDTAKGQEYTFNGEIFSVDDMAKLAKEYMPQNSKTEVYNGDLNTHEIREFILDGGIILVPYPSDIIKYDTNKDNSPGKHNGHKAHWAVISGGIETLDNFFVLARHGKARNVAVWKLNDLAESNGQLLEFSPDRKLHDVEYKLPKEGISGPLGLNKKCVLIRF